MSQQIVVARHCGRDCRNPEAMEGELSHPCVLDAANPWRHDGISA